MAVRDAARGQDLALDEEKVKAVLNDAEVDAKGVISAVGKASGVSVVGRGGGADHRIVTHLAIQRLDGGPAGRDRGEDEGHERGADGRCKGIAGRDARARSPF